MLVRFAAVVVCLLVLSAAPSFGQDDAGNTFLEAEELDFGQLSVTAELLVEFRGPDLYLGIRDEFGGISQTDDDSSIYGDSYAPGLTGVPVNPGGEIAFDITGFGDDDFVGDHVEFGEFEAFIDIYTVIDDESVYLDGLYFQDTIDDQVAEQAVLSFFDSNMAWDGALYDVQVNNAIPNDIDFFRFIGLTPGEGFTAETLPVEGGFVDTALGLFDESGNLINSNDDADESAYSKLTGIVPASGEVVLAVTGYQDIESFDGSHPFLGPYELALTLGDVAIPGDYDGDLDVDADDYDAWQAAYGNSGVDLPADGNGDDQIDAADYTVWRDAFSAASSSAVPEPGTLVLAITIAFNAAAAGRWRRRQA